MSLFQKNPNVQPIDKNSSAFAINRFTMARSNLVAACAFTLLNIIISVIGADLYFLFSIAYPYYMFSLESVIDIILPLAVLAFYFCCYIFSKKKPGFMIAALVAFILDFLFLIVFSFLIWIASEGEVSMISFLLDYIFHIWVLVYLIIGVVYRKRYIAAMNTPVETATPEGAEIYNVPMAEKPVLVEQHAVEAKTEPVEPAVNEEAPAEEQTENSAEPDKK